MAPGMGHRGLAILARWRERGVDALRPPPLKKTLRKTLRLWAHKTGKTTRKVPARSHKILAKKNGCER
jgi:hypothetical protein